MKRVLLLFRVAIVTSKADTLALATRVTGVVLLSTLTIWIKPTIGTFTAIIAVLTESSSLSSIDFLFAV